MRVLAVGAHPDDFEYGCFGTLALHAMNNDELFGLTLSKGNLGGDGRESEGKSGADVIGMNLTFGHFQDGVIKNDLETVSFIENFVKKHEIDVIYTTSLHDRHQDHRNVALSVLVAGRTVSEIYSFETISCVNDFHPTMFVDISDVINVKHNALSKHVSQSQKYYIKNIDYIHKYRALKIGDPDKFYESFEVLKIVK